MSKERIEALEHEIARLKQRLEQPEVAINFVVAMKAGQERLIATIKNVGILPVHGLVMQATAEEKQMSLDFQLDTLPTVRCSLEETWEFWTGPQAEQLLKARPQHCRVVANSGGQVIGQSEAAALDQALGMVN